MHSFLLILTALIWGAAFLAQKLGADHLGPYTFTACRSGLAGIALLGVLALRKKALTRARSSTSPFIAGFWCGLALFVATVFQQIGIAHTTPGISAFLTANYVLIVPFLGLFLGTKPKIGVWIGVALSLLGLFFICLCPTGPFTWSELPPLGRGEVWTLLCAFGYAIHILVVAHFAPKCDILAMTCVQFFMGAILGLPFLLLPSEQAFLTANAFRLALPGILFCGFLSSGVAYTLQNVAQGKVAPAIASILMSLESVFALFFGWLIRHDTMTPRQLIGCGLVLAAVLIAQIWGASEPQK